MPGDLSYWEQSLDTHFRTLASIRGGLEGGRTLFALEHNLQQGEVDALCAAIRQDIAQHSPRNENSLAWIVYAAELGYRYSGDEYWQTFEQETPGWSIHGDRYWIRERYRAFQQRYGGAKPSGAWAENFSIICWPITHAILPRDLQRQLAQILYQIRHSFSAELFESPVRFGELIEVNSWSATSRFRKLAQETKLVGQIAAALLLQGRFGTDSLIYPPTLVRISKDLDQERRARDWLRRARRSAEERVQLRGLGLGHRSPPIKGQREEARAEVENLGIDPRLVLRPLDSESSSWEVYLEIPDLSPLLLRFPSTREILAGTRCVVAGAAGRPLARGRCLHGSQRVLLERWPRADEVLLQFERTEEQLDYILRAECLLRPGPSWLFRIASDGLAYEMRSLRVRPGEQYVLLTTDDVLAARENTRPVRVKCESVRGVALALPSAVTPSWEETLRQLGLRQARALEVWPAGLSAIIWDGEGHAEWLASEQPCLGISSDHSLDALFVSIADSAEPPLELSPIAAGEPVFAELPQLPVGIHRVRVSAQAAPGVERELLGDLDVVMRIRESRHWSPGVSPYGPLLAQIDPISPTLEELWEGRFSLTLQGPSGRSIVCKAKLLQQDADRPLFAKLLPPIRFPVRPNAWRSHFEGHFRRMRQAEEAYDLARSCELEFVAEELGALTIRCEREFTPLRWALRRRKQDHVLRLVDDSGDGQGPLVTRLAFVSPCVEEALDCRSEFEVTEGGGLYIARGGRAMAAIIVPPVVRDLADLGFIPRVDQSTRSEDSILHLVRCACLWGQARVAGNFVSAMRQRDVLLALVRQIFRVLCGVNWARAEVTASSGPLNISRLQDAISTRRDHVAIGVILARDVADLAKKTRGERICVMSSLLRRFRLISLPPSAEGSAEWLSEFALRLASDPASIETWAGDRLRDGLQRLLDCPTLGRVARFMVLTTDDHLRSAVAPGELFASWRWR